MEYINTYLLRSPRKCRRKVWDEGEYIFRDEYGNFVTETGQLFAMDLLQSQAKDWEDVGTAPTKEELYTQLNNRAFQYKDSSKDRVARLENICNLSRLESRPSNTIQNSITDVLKYIFFL